MPVYRVCLVPEEDRRGHLRTGHSYSHHVGAENQTLIFRFWFLFFFNLSLYATLFYCVRVLDIWY